MTTPIEWFKPKMKKNIIESYVFSEPRRWKYGKIKYTGKQVEVRFKSGEVRDIITTEDIGRYMKKKGLDKKYF